MRINVVVQVLCVTVVHYSLINVSVSYTVNVEVHHWKTDSSEFNHGVCFTVVKLRGGLLEAAH